MRYLDHIRACNAHDPNDLRPFVVDGEPVGLVTGVNAAALQDYDAFEVRPDAVGLAPGLVDQPARSRAVAAVVGDLAARGRIRPLRGELYPVLSGWGAPVRLALDRAAVPFFGVPAHGIHVNGFVRRANGLHLWIGRRSRNVAVAPGQLDHLVAGGQPLGLSLRENLLKEAREEAGLSPEIAGRAVPVGVITYKLAVPEGLRNDRLFLYDLELPEDVTPVNTDGEVEAFTLLPADEVARIVRTSFDFKFNCALVVIDFLMRHGLIDPEDRDYVALAQGLRQ